VIGITHGYKLKTRYARLRAKGWLTRKKLQIFWVYSVRRYAVGGERKSLKPIPIMIEMDAFTNIPASIRRL
jgi:hypothetical protein